MATKCGRYARIVEQAITGYHQDDVGDWVAELACGHDQHVRHRPPFQLREWVLDADGRAGRLGRPLACPLCDRGEPPDRSPRVGSVQDEGGDPACWAGLVCPDCGAIVDGGGHRPGCRTR
jgi:uncharacterized protein DUF3565